VSDKKIGHADDERQGDHSGVADGELLGVRRDAPEPFEPADHPLDNVAGPIRVGVEHGLAAAHSVHSITWPAVTRKLKTVPARSHARCSLLPQPPRERPNP